MASSFIPKGSYKNSVTNICVTLQCDARKKDQSTTPVTLDLTNYSVDEGSEDNEYGIHNDDGVLAGHETQNFRIENFNSFKPNGSYVDSCNNIKVVLSCEATKEDRESRNAELDITNLNPATADIANINGRLFDMSTHIQDAFNHIKKMFPQYAGFLEDHKADIFSALTKGSPSDLLIKSFKDIEKAVEEVEKNLEEATKKTAETVEKIAENPCVEEIAMVVVNIIFLIFSLFGLKVVLDQKYANILRRQLGEETLNGLETIMSKIQHAKEAEHYFEVTQCLLSVFNSTLNLTAVKECLKEALSTASWWTRVESGITIVAQFIIWFGSDGAALIVEIGLVITSAADLFLAVDKAILTCSE